MALFALKTPRILCWPCMGGLYGWWNCFNRSTFQYFGLTCLFHNFLVSHDESRIQSSKWIHDPISLISPLTVHRSKFFKTAFWMRKHLALTWKRTWFWSTSRRIENLDLGPLLPEEKQTTVKTTKRWKQDGKTKWQGTKALKGTQ